MQDAQKRREPANYKVSRALGVAIVTGGYVPGAQLPGEFEIAEQMGVSRSVVREAVRMLAAKGLVESRPKIGTRVRERRHWSMLDPDLLEWMFESEPSEKFVRDLFALRMVVEPAAAEMAAQMRTARHLSEMGYALEKMAEFTLRVAEGQQADERFHAAILDATGNELIANLSASICAAVHWTTHFKVRRFGNPRDSLEEHRALFEAIANADGPAAREAAVVLIEHARRDTEVALATLQPDPSEKRVIVGAKKYEE
ncbi:FadR family transcriptional regulator [Novosphingobium sp. 1949]|uniref:FadR family transcriptional regulator n=1 Tax=Novosphingobium organovorum TaxID=2930092 RepID=A0ABT0B8T3_9SPHN|nr:FadR/GntR family transcriptional regulator [Novosphingobium organovorum]MCJ2181275.1 FadR family transcriptional regulator [Novosphingobium organovorum]